MDAQQLVFLFIKRLSQLDGLFFNMGRNVGGYSKSYSKIRPAVCVFSMSYPFGI